MPKSSSRAFRWFALPALTLAFAMGTSPAEAQRKKKPDAAAEKKPAGETVELDADQPAQPSGPQDLGPPPTAGAQSDAMAAAKRKFNERKWADAAVELYAVYKGDTKDDEGNRQLAQFDLAVALYNLKYYQGAYGIFSEIAEKSNHLKFNQTLLWLAKLATELPEPADIVERVGKYNEQQINAFRNESQIDLFWQLNYLLGRYKYRNRQYEDAIRLLGNVSPKSKYYIKSNFFTGISNVQLRRSIPAVKAFTNVVKAIDEGVEGVDDDARMRDLAFLSMARTYYSASVTLDANNSPTIDEKRLSAAVVNWNKVETESEYWLDALFEESWAYFMAGDYSHALGNVHTIQSPYFPDSYYPEADILKALIYFFNCQYPDTETIVARFQQKYQPMYDELKQVLGRFKGDAQEEAFYKFLKDVRDDKADLSPRIRTVVKAAMSDRELLRYISYIELLDEEGKRLKKAPPRFQSSPLSNDVKDALQLARDIAVRNAGELARKRYQRNLDELNEHLRDSTKISIEITAAKRNQLGAAMAGSQVSTKESERNIVKPDEEHVIWPFNGEYWRDELGFYRQTITSKCAR